MLLLDPDYGLVNTLLAKLPFVGKGPFNIYSFWGIVWVHVITGSLTVKVILLTPAFRNMNASFEEAHDEMLRLARGSDPYEAHVALIRHGRRRVRGAGDFTGCD